jgi:hypothetical protein
MLYKHTNQTDMFEQNDNESDVFHFFFKLCKILTSNFAFKSFPPVREHTTPTHTDVELQEKFVIHNSFNVRFDFSSSSVRSIRFFS